MKQAMLYVGPFDFSAMRYVLGTVVLFAILLARRQSLRPPPLLQTLLLGLVQTMGFQVLVQWALVDGGAGKTALLAYSMPFWVVLLGWMFFAQHLSRRHLLGVIAAAMGLLLVLEPWLGIGAGKSVLLALGGGLAWAFGTLLSKRMFERGEATVLSLSAWQMLFGSIGLLVLTLLVDERRIEWSGYLIFAVAYNGVLASGLAWLLWLLVVKRLPTHIAGVSSLAIPVMSVGFAWAVLGEQPSLVEMCGIALIAAALAAIHWPSKVNAAPSK